MSDLIDPHHLSHPKYRADIDGLRAIAVLSVVGFHAFPKSIKGGFIGVDIFFVISGFLISSILLDSLRRNSFSFSEFYSRRIKRIFPALLLVLIATYGIGWFILAGNEFKSLGKQISGGAAFVSNFVFLNESGYFEGAAETKPLLNLWSLGIEEQYYILWPLILWLGWKLRLNLLLLALTLFVVSFALNIAMIRSSTAATFYSPQTRFWELLAGSILAYVTLYRDIVIERVNRHADLLIYRMPKWAVRAIHHHKRHDIQSIFGAGLIIFGIFVTKKSHFPGWWALIPTLGTVLIISAGSHAVFNRKFLAKRILVWFGLISFPLYLWHWPLLSFATIIEGNTPPAMIRVSIVLASILLSWLTYKLIEIPIRYGKNGDAKTVVLACLMILIGYIGFNAYQRNGLEFRAKNFSQVSRAIGEWDFPGNLEQFKFGENIFYSMKSNRSTTTLFIGDSNIAQYYPRFAELIHRNPKLSNSVIFSTEFGCLPIPGARYKEIKHCDGLLDRSLSLALSRPDISTVVIGGHWFAYLSGNGTNILHNGERVPIEKEGRGYDIALAELGNVIRVLKENHKRVILILNIPFGNELDPKSMIQRSLRDFPDVLKLRIRSLNLNQLMEQYGNIRRDLKLVAKENEIEVIDPIDYLCDLNTCPSVDTNGEPIYKDGSHLRPSFVRTQAFFVDRAISE